MKSLVRIKLFHDIIFKECTDEELILIADYLNATFDDSITDEEYDRLFLEMKSMVRKYENIDIRHGGIRSDEESCKSI
jgi:hypothetical protein